jgi:hypothetical protein
MLYAGLLGAYSGAMECELFSGTKAHQPTLPFLFHKHQNLIFCQTQYQCHGISCAGTSSRTRELHLGSYVSQGLLNCQQVYDENFAIWHFCSSHMSQV